MTRNIPFLLAPQFAVLATGLDDSTRVFRQQVRDLESFMRIHHLPRQCVSLPSHTLFIFFVNVLVFLTRSHQTARQPARRHAAAPERRGGAP